MNYVVGTLKHQEEKITITYHTYPNNSPALQLNDASGEYYATLTVNVPDTKLEKDEILIKTWSENEKIAKTALDSGLFIDTGKRVKTGCVEAQIWKLTPR